MSLEEIIQELKKIEDAAVIAQSIINDFKSPFEIEEKEIFVTVILSKVALSLIIIVALYFLSGVISDFFFESRKYQTLIELIAVAILFQSFFGVIVGHFQAIQNFKVFS